MVDLEKLNNIKIFQLKEKVKFTENFTEDIKNLWPSGYDYIVSLPNKIDRMSIEKKLYKAYFDFNTLFVRGIIGRRQFIDGDIIACDDDCYSINKDKFIFIGKMKAF